MSKQEKYSKISKEIINDIGGVENIQGVAHCATRLRIVLKDLSLVNTQAIEEVDLVKGSFIAGSQLQIVFGAGTVNEVYSEFITHTDTKEMSLSDVKAIGAKKENPIQKVIKSLSDVFVEIIPAILAAAILLGVTGFLQKFPIFETNATLHALNRLASLASVGIFAILPMAVCYSAVKRYGGRPILGLVVGAIMLDGSLANAYSIGTAGFNPEILNLFGLKIELVGFQGGIIVALMMGFIVAKLDQYFEKKIPDVIKLLISPMLTVLISTLLLFIVVGPFGRQLAYWITSGLVYISTNFGVIGYAFFAGIQQIIVITGLHHVFGAAEAQLLAQTGTNFLNPLMSVALMGQGGAVIGYLILNFKSKKAHELSISSFVSILFGISEPAIFGINLKNKFPLIAGCIGGAVGGAYVSITHLTSLGFGATAIPGFFIASPANNGYVNYIIAHAIALVVAMVMCVLFGKTVKKNEVKKEVNMIKNAEVAVETTNKVVKISSPMEGEILEISKSNDPTFASKVMGEGFAINPTSNTVVAPADATVEFVFPTKHALGLILEDGSKLLIHCGIDTVNLNGEGFNVFVNANEKIKKGTPLLEMDLETVRKNNYSAQTLVVVAEVAQNKTVTVDTTKETIIEIK